MAKLINENTPELVKLVPGDVARRHNIFPVSKAGEVMTIAMSDPANLFAVDDLKLITKCLIQTVAA
ncbi:MAG: type II secretion system protein GspE, partial [Candidatus Omnitrophica bacterium]|nr:type II secretion system protein GspE [Candidatus Omnitrophota bacterium]